MLNYKLIYCSTVANEITEEIEKNKYVNSVTAGRITFFDWLQELVAKGWKVLFKALDPFVLYGASTMIVLCVIVWFCSKDKRVITSGVKGFFIYLIWCFLRGQLL